jgi:hypothetical protein
MCYGLSARRGLIRRQRHRRMRVRRAQLTSRSSDSDVCPAHVHVRVPIPEGRHHMTRLPPPTASVGNGRARRGGLAEATISEMEQLPRMRLEDAGCRHALRARRPSRFADSPACRTPSRLRRRREFEATRPHAIVHCPRAVFELRAPGEIRTPDPQVRSLMLYPTELRARRADSTANPRA